MYSKIFAKGKTISLIYKCILAFLYFMDRGFLPDDLILLG